MRDDRTGQKTGPVKGVLSRQALRTMARRRAAMAAAIEPLEGRLLLSTVDWLGGTGNWNSAANWSTGLVPVIGDTVNITVPGSVVDVTDSERSDNITTASGTTLDIQASGYLFLDNGGTISGTLTVDAASGDYAAGEIGAGYNSPLDLAGTTTLNGLFYQGDFTNDGTLNLDSASFLGGTTLTNDTTLNISGGLNSANATLINTTNGNINLLDDDGLSGGGNLTNSGTLTLNGGSGTSAITGPTLVDTGGSISVETGTLSDQQSAYFQNANFDISSGAAFAFDTDAQQDNVFYFSGTNTNTGSGYLLFDSAIARPGAPDGAATSSFLDFANGTTQITGTVFDFSPQDGSIQEITNSGYLDYVGSATHGSMGLINQGVIQISGSGDLDVDRNGAFTNAYTGVLDFEADAGITNLNGNTAFYNYGLIEKTAGTGVSVIGATTGVENIGFANLGGGFNVQTGTISLVNDDGDFQWNAGPITVATGATLDINTGGGRIWSSGNFSSSGGGQVTFTSGNWYGASSGLGQTVAGVLDFAPGAFIDQGGEFVDDNLTNSGVIEFNGSNSLNGISNSGTLVVNGPSFGFGGTVNNSGVIDFTVGMALGQQFSPVNNSGTIEFTAGSGALDLSQVNGLTNTGLMLVEGGTLILQQSGNSFANYTIPAGATYEAEDGGTITFSTTYHPITEIDGTVILSGAGSAFTPLSGLNDLTGTLEVLDGASFSTTGSLTSSGTLSVGGDVTINGDFDETGTPTLNFAVSGLPNSAGAPDLVVTGNTTLAGNLTAEFSGGIGSNSDAYTVAGLANASGGSFASTAGVGPAFTAQINPTTIVLNGVGLPAVNAQADTYTVQSNTALVVPAGQGVLSNDTDPNHGTLGAVLLTDPSHGLLLFNSDGSFTYLPVAGYQGQDSFTYYATDGAVTSTPTTVTLHVGQAQAVFSDLTPPISATFGTASETFSGVVGAGDSYVPTGETVAITFDGLTQDATVGSGGAFSATFSTSTLPVSQTPYPVTYAYAGDDSFLTVTDSATTTVTVGAISATIQFGDLQQTYDGSPEYATATTTPSGLNVEITYKQGNTVVADPTNAGSYTVDATIDSVGYSGSNTTTLVIAQASSAFSGLTAPASITAGAASETFSGVVSANGLYPPSTEDVAVTLDGVTREAAIGANGAFSSTFNTSSLAASATPYAVTYAYNGDSNFTSASDSSTTTLTVNEEVNGPVVTLNPVSQTAASGEAIIMTADATGTPTPSVQWQQSSSGAVGTFTNVAATTVTPTTGGVATELLVEDTSTEYYQVVFSNGGGTVTSAVAKITVNALPTPPTPPGLPEPKPVIDENPTSQTVPSGVSVTFTAEAVSLIATTAQWQVSTDGGVTFTNITGANATSGTFFITTSYTVTASAANNGDEYRAVFTDAGGSVDTTAVELILNTAPVAIAPVVTLNPLSQSILAGNQATLTAAASGTPTPTVQWQVATSALDALLGLFTNITDATSTTYSFTTSAAENGYVYRAVFTNSAGTATTANATLTVNAPPTITTQPQNTSFADGTASFSAVGTSASNPAPTVVWQGSVTGAANSFVNLPASDVNTLTILDNAYSYLTLPESSGYQYVRAVFTNQYGSTPSSVATVVVPVAPTITLNPVSQSAAITQQVTFTAAANGSPAPTVQWEVSTNGGLSYTAIAGATSDSYSFTARAGESGNLYRAVFTNAGSSVTTSAATLTLTGGPVITLDPTSPSVTLGTRVTLTAAATGTPTPTVQWQVNTGTSWNNIAGATSTSYSFTATLADNGNEYRAVFTNAIGSAISTAATLALTGAPVITLDPVSPSVTAGTRVTLTAAATGTPTPTVQWQVNNGLVWTNIAGATSTSYTFTATSGLIAYEYRAVFTNMLGSATTTAATVTIITPPVITLNPSNGTYTLPTDTFGGSEPPTVSVTAAATGIPTPSVTWQGSATGAAGSFVNLPSSDWTNQVEGLNGVESTLTLSQTSGIVYVQAVFTNTYGTETTSIAHLTPAAPAKPVIESSPISQTTGVGDEVNLVAFANAYPAITSVQWQVSTNGGRSWSNISGANSDTYSFNATASENGNQYRAVFTNSVGSTDTAAATLTVAQLTIVENPTSTTHNGVRGYVAVATGVPNAPTAVWQISSNGGTTWTNVPAGDIVNVTSGDELTTFVPLSAIPNGDSVQVVFTETYGGDTFTV